MAQTRPFAKPNSTGFAKRRPRKLLVKIGLSPVGARLPIDCPNALLSEPVPLFAAFRSNSEAELTTAKTALRERRLVVTDVLLGDEGFADTEFHACDKQVKAWVLTPEQLSRKRRWWKHDLFAYRKETVELLFQRVMQAVGITGCVAKGTGKNAAFILTGVWRYQICWLENYRVGKSAAIIKEQIDLARWRTPK